MFGIVYLMLLLLVVLFEDRLLYHPARAGQVTAPGEDVWLRTSDGVTLHARYTANDPQLPTLIYLHGTAGNLANRSDRLALFATLGANLLALDYRGYGRSAGSPSEAARVAAPVTRGGSHGTVLVLFTYGSSGPPVVTPAAGRVTTSPYSQLSAS